MFTAALAGGLPFDAVLMAGGKGERLRPLTEKTPKPLVKVGDKCIIDYNIDNLIAYTDDHMSLITAIVLLKRKFTVNEIIDNYYSNINVFENDLF